MVHCRGHTKCASEAEAGATYCTFKQHVLGGHSLPKDGRRLRRSEWPAPVLGTLVIRESAADKNNFKRHIRAAQLKVTKDAFSTSPIDAFTPLADPQLLPAPEGKLLIRGVELAVSGELVFEHE